ncbi:cation:proton antiporter [Ruminococcus sp. HUN007]|uniref:cation:proton antiporter n=1 Tax=Ruminococcus sp. HUN007 TaxID=1514668 RepID=UPI0005D2CF19|nr:cation:proton antiporter [Ruminococcus sp. HUN007]
MDYILFIALILMSTKVLGLMTKKIHLPQVVGALIAGLVLGPGLGLVHETEFIKNISEIGVIVLMFSAGLETDIKELKKCGLASFVIALIGVIVPLAGGFGVAHFFNNGETTLPTSIFLQNIFIGVILTATSVSITVETLKELGKLSSNAGNAIIGAALMDDILGIIALTVITSIADPNAPGIGTVLLKILGFFVFGGVFGVVFHILFVRWTDKTTAKLHRYNVMSFAFCLLFAYVAEELFGVADITGAFLAGILISTSTKIKYISSRFETLSYMLLSPVFFASIGINVKLSKGDMNSTIISFSLLLLVVAIITKIIGCGLGAKLCKYTTKESLQIGIGMVSRGEVALIVANKGQAVGLMDDRYFGPIVIVVVITTIITPILLKIVFADKNENDSVPVEKAAN